MNGPGYKPAGSPVGYDGSNWFGASDDNNGGGQYGVSDGTFAWDTSGASAPADAVETSAQLDVYSCLQANGDGSGWQVFGAWVPGDLSATAQWEPSSSTSAISGVAIPFFANGADPYGCVQGTGAGNHETLALNPTYGGINWTGYTGLQFRIANQPAWPSSTPPTTGPSASGNYIYLVGYANGANPAPVLSVTWHPVAPAPTLASPINGAHVNTLTPPLQVSPETDSDGDPLLFRFNLSASIGGPLLWSTGWTSSSSFTVPSAVLAWQQPYYWQACAWDGVDPNGTSQATGGECSGWASFQTAFTYVAMGDSYASGEGNPPFTDSDGCDRSNAAYGPLFNQQVTSVQGVDFRFVACSGATTDNMTTSDQHFPTQLAQIRSLDSSTRMITLNAGGDNINFATIMAFCIAVGCSPGGSSLSSDIANLGRNIANLQAQLVQTYEALVTQTANNANIYILNYPDLLPPNPNFLQSTAASLACPQVFVNPFTDEGDIAFLAPFERQLNDVIQLAAGQAALHSANPAVVQFIDTNAPGAVYSFLGHDVCQPPGIGNGSWFNGLEYPNSYSLHPNATGQQMMELALVTRSAGPAPSAASQAAPSPLNASQLADLADLPTSGPALSIDEVSLTSNSSAQSISGVGFAPGSLVQVCAIAPGDLGAVTADANGAVTATIGSLLGLVRAPYAIVLRGSTPNGDSRIVFALTSAGLTALGQR